MTATCPECQAELEADVNLRKKRGHRPRVTTRRQRRAERATRYNSEAVAILPNARPMPDLASGESATIRTPVRAQTVESDWLVPVLQALTTGAFGALLSALPTALIEALPWYTPLAVWSTVAGGAWFLTSKSARGLLMLVEEFTGQDIDGDGEIGNEREEISVNVHDRAPDDHRLAQDVRCTLFSPAGKPGNLARYAAALMRDNETRATFSYAGGKQVNGAKFYGYTPAEFTEIERVAVAAKLAERERKNQPYEFTDRGRAVFGRVARRGLSETTLSPIPQAQEAR